MKFINELKEGDKVKEIYLCKKITTAQTKAGKTYWNVTLQDKTGVVDGKIWTPDSPGIDDFEAKDYIWVCGEVTVFNSANQINISQVRKASEGEYAPDDYLPCTDKNVDEMYEALLKLIRSVKAPYMNALLMGFFGNEDFKKMFCFHSAAKSVHHGFVGGLLEHTLAVVRICDFMSHAYPVLRRDLLITAAMLHDIGKTQELSDFPVNEFTDDGQLLGHIMIGAEMVHDHAAAIPGFPKVLETELKHCILAHHGEYEYGSPKKPALMEAMALNLADNMDAKMETWTEILTQAGENNEWLGYNKLFESNIRRTQGL